MRSALKSHEMSSAAMKHLLLVTISVFSTFCGNACAQSATEELAQERICEGFDTCDLCVQAEPYCVWCYQENFSDLRCGPKAALLKRGCDEKYIFLNGENSTIVGLESDKNFNDVTDPDNVDESVQIKPQRISVKLQPKQPLNFQFKYRLAKNYPLDLYYLMDLTLTMEHDVTTMATLGKELTNVLQNLTKHFRVAFGYYSDKVAMPFSKMTPTFVENPCADLGRSCKRAFDFVHGLNFTDKIDAFIREITESKTTANLDNLEGGFDALYQIILCEKEIQWRKNSRRIIVVATDGTLHFAGDGKLAGSVKRNADRCLLDENGVYDMSLVYDYPSLEEVYRRLLKHKMNVLFAAKEDAIKYYEDLNKVIPSVSYVGKLAEKSTNVLNLVKEGYYKVVQNVKFTSSPSENVQITFRANCNQRRIWNLSSTCDNVEEGKEYTFDVTLEVKQVPKDIERETIIIEEKNIAEKLVIEIQYVGKCKCNMGFQGKRCSGHGTYKCGICECEEGWKGENCDRSCIDQNFEACREKNETYTSGTCYGRGDCDCGRCICDLEYTGKFCKHKQCPKNRKGEVCSGHLHGVCNDGKCHCLDMYMGEDCSCPRSTENCKAPGSDEVCSSAGYCRCGKCICRTRYDGQYCEVCPTCTGLCSTYEQCVLDTLANQTSSENCFTEDGAAFIAEMVDHPLEAADTAMCTIRHDKEDGHVCYAQFKYNIRKDFIVELQIHDECAKPVQASTVIAIIIAAILGVGIIFILLWKAKLMNDDRREYAKFQEELHRSKTLEENPLYNSPIRTYQMPTELQLFRSDS